MEAVALYPSQGGLLGPWLSAGPARVHRPRILQLPSHRLLSPQGLEENMCLQGQ